MTSLYWEELRLQDAAAQTGTPALFVSERRLRANIRGLRDGLPGATLRYCAKTNPELGILRIVHDEGLDVLASHEAEVRLALAAGFAPEQIAFQKPALERDELDAVLAHGVRRVHAFRAADLDLLPADVRISLRIAIARSGMPVLSAASRRLGFDPAAVQPRDGVDALNAYIGTQQENPEAYRPAIRELVRLAHRLGPIEELNLGGGIPSNSLRKLTPSRLLTRGRADFVAPQSPEGYAAQLGRIFAEETGGKFRMALEPGRSIVGNAAVLLTRVVAEQGSWRFLDCGRNVLVESPLAFTRWIAPVEARSGRREKVDLSGPTLNTLDVIDRGRVLPPLRTGDVLAVGDAGAYTIARATRYAGLAPAVWLARLDGSLTCIRRAETYADFTAPMESAD